MARTIKHPSDYFKWTDDATRRLIELFPTHQEKAIAEILGITYDTVHSKTITLGLRRCHYPTADQVKRFHQLKNLISKEKTVEIFGQDFCRQIAKSNDDSLPVKWENQSKTFPQALLEVRQVIRNSKKKSREIAVKNAEIVRVKKNRRWTEDDLRLLTELFPFNSDSILCERLCRSTKEIGKQAKKLNLKKDPDYVKNLLTVAESRTAATGETRKLKIRNVDRFAVIDAEDYERVAGFDWRGYVQNSNRTVVYFNSKVNDFPVKIYLARMILNLDETNARIVYRNGNTLDLRKENLKVKINIGTPRPVLCFSKNLWLVQLILNGKIASVGSYQTKAEGEAAIASIPAEITQNSSYKNAAEFREAVNNWKTRNEQSKGIYKRQILQKGQLAVKTGSKYVVWARIVWENAYGKIPDDNFIIFKDGNKQNCDLKNLKRVDRRNMSRLIKLYQYPPPVRETVLAIWKLKKVINDPKLRKNYQPKQRQPGEVKTQAKSLVRADGGRFWTADENTKLKSLYRTQSNAELGKIFNRSPKALTQHAMSLGITSPEPIKFWTTEKLALLREIYPTTDSEQCAARFGCTVNAVYAQTKKMGIRKDSEFVRKTLSEIQKKLYSPTTFKSKKSISEVNYAQ